MLSGSVLAACASLRSPPLLRIHPKASPHTPARQGREPRLRRLWLPGDRVVRREASVGQLAAQAAARCPTPWSRYPPQIRPRQTWSPRRDIIDSRNIWAPANTHCRHSHIGECERALSVIGQRARCPITETLERARSSPRTGSHERREEPTAAAAGSSRCVSRSGLRTRPNVARITAPSDHSITNAPPCYEPLAQGAPA